MRAILEQINTHGPESFLARHFIVPGFRFLWHLHPEVELTLIIKGQGRRLVGDSVLPFAAGDIVLLGKNLPHTWSSEPRRGENVMRHEAIVIQFLEHSFGPAFFDLPEMRPIRWLLDGSARGILFTGQAKKSVAPLLTRLPQTHGPSRLASFIQILSQLAESRAADRTILASPGFATEVHLSGQRRIADVCRWINEHFDQPLTLPEAAARAHLSVSAFSRFFKNATAKTFIDYVNEVRIGHACRLLLDTEQDIAGIAYAAGFSNLSHFNRRFLRSKNRSPRAFRQAYTHQNP